MKQPKTASLGKLVILAATAVAPVPLNAGGIAVDPRSGAVVQAKGQEVLVAPAFGAKPTRTFHTPGFFTPVLFRNNLVFGRENPGSQAEVEDVAVLYDLLGQRLFESGYMGTSSLAADGSAVLTVVNPPRGFGSGNLEDETLTWEQLVRETGKAQLPMPRKDAFIVRSCRLAPLSCEFDFYGPELFGLQGDHLLVSAVGVAHRDAVFALDSGVVARVKEGKLVWRTQVVDPLSSSLEVWDLRPEWDTLVLGSDHSGALWLLALSPGEIRGRWVPTEDATLAALLFPQGVEKAVSQKCWLLEEGNRVVVPLSYLEEIRTAGKEAFLRAELIHVWLAKLFDKNRAVAVIGGAPAYAATAAHGPLVCPQPYRIVAVDLTTAQVLSAKPVVQLFPAALRTDPSFDPQNAARPQLATGAGSIIVCMGDNSLCAPVSQEILRESL